MSHCQWFTQENNNWWGAVTEITIFQAGAVSDLCLGDAMWVEKELWDHGFGLWRPSKIIPRIPNKACISANYPTVKFGFYPHTVLCSLLSRKLLPAPGSRGGDWLGSSYRPASPLCCLPSAILCKILVHSCIPETSLRLEWQWSPPTRTTGPSQFITKITNIRKLARSVGLGQPNRYKHILSNINEIRIFQMLCGSRGPTGLSKLRSI